MKKYILLLFCSFFALCAAAQESTASFNVLKLPSMPHAAALGGKNVTLIEDAPSVGWQNPALYANTSDLSLELNFMNYVSSSTWMGAAFTKALGERHTLAVMAQYMNYGSMQETDEMGQVLGEFSPKDIIIGGGYSYLLSDRWSGGANAKFLFSNLGDYSAIAMAFDLGLNYYDEEKDLSISAALLNLGTQIKAYDNGLRTHLPCDLTLGFSMGAAHLPIRWHVTLSDMTRWKSRYFALPGEEEKEISFGKMALNHVALGLDVMPADPIRLSIGYNFRRGNELKAAGSGSWAGLTAGAGLNIKKFKFDVAYARYHKAANSIMVSAGYQFCTDSL